MMMVKKKPNNKIIQFCRDCYNQSKEISNKYPYLNQSLIKNYIKEGEIDFPKSNTKLDSCKTYFFNLSKNNISTFEVVNCSKIIKLKNITLY